MGPAVQPGGLRRRAVAAAGLALTELLVTLLLTLLVASATLAVVNPSRARFSAELESIDMEQRVRVVADTLTRDLAMAGSGIDLPRGAGSLVHAIPSILPFRQGAITDDPPGTFRPDTVTVLYVPSSAARSTLTAALGPGHETLQVQAHSGCPTGSTFCGFSAGMTVIVYDTAGAFDTFVLTGVAGGTGTLRVNRAGGVMEATYPTGSRVAQVVQRTYFLRADLALQTHQLMRYDGTTNSSAPVADHVVGLTFEYYGDPRPPAITRPITEMEGPWTTFGPPPTAPDVQRLPHPPGENCLFIYDAATARHHSKLLPLAAGGTLTRMTASDFTDGPFWCPDDVSARRYDADLFRIRSVGVTIRIQASQPMFRGPAGPLFTNGGTSTSAHRYLPDREVRFRVSPRNLTISR